MLQQPHYIRYLLTRMAMPMLLTCVTLTGVGWLTQSLQFIDYIVNRGLSIGTFMYLSTLILPSILWVILPVALFISLLYAFHKLAAESELVIFWGAGIGFRELLRPVLMFTGAVTLFSYLVGLYLLPASYREFKDMQAFIRDNYASLLLQEGVFATPTKGLTVYIRERDAEGKLHGMLVHDSRDPQKVVTYMAENGELQQSSTGPRFLLEKGNRQEIDKSAGNLTLLDFERYALEFSLFATDIHNRRWREPQERYLPDLFYPQDTAPGPQMKKLRAEGHHRVTWPLFNVLLALLALSPFLLGQFSRRGQGKKVAVAGGVAVVMVILELTLTSMTGKNNWLALLMYFTILAGIATLYYLMHIRGQTLKANSWTQRMWRKHIRV